MIECRICGAKIHSVQLHLAKDHPDFGLAQYRDRFPEAPLLSEEAKERIAQKRAEQQAAAESESAEAESGVRMSHAVMSATVVTMPSRETKGKLHEVFELGMIPGAMSTRGDPINITLFHRAGRDAELVPVVDKNHVWDVVIVKDILMALELNMPLYVWGFHGTGKTTDIEQICARTGRPVLRVQHTLNTEEAHIIGQWIAIDGSTKFNPGPLAMAMRYGWTYLADEYDFALPSVLSVYQPVLEGKPLIIKDADDEWRIVRPHADFRFAATGNTNGSGDDTGLYQGTSVQNAANYDRFAMTIRKSYMKESLEISIIEKQAGIAQADAKRFVTFGKLIREGYEAGKISATVSPRALINAAKIGLRKASWTDGLDRAFINKLNKVDSETARQIAQRCFSGK